MCWQTYTYKLLLIHRQDVRTCLLYTSSSYGFAKALIQIPFGVVTNKIGDKLLLIISFILMAIVPFSYTLNKSSLLASIIYIAQGAVLGMSAPATFALLSRSLDESKRGECTGYASAVFTLSLSLIHIW